MLTMLCAITLAQAPVDDFARWEKDVAAIEKRHTGAKPGGIAFAGSSSIVKWNLAKSFPDRPVFNCGFGGNQIRHNTHFAERTIVPLAPAKIVFYAGDNDLGAKRSPEQVRDDFAAFMKLMHEKLPKATVHYLPIKPSVKRWELYETQKKANAYVLEMAKTDAQLNYIDIVPLMLGADGKPDPALFVADGLHLSEAGYAKWTEAVKAALQ
jgi:hypothetical protein